MKLPSALLAGASLALAFCFGAGAAQATTIDTVPAWLLTGGANFGSFGGPGFGAGVFGETFTAPGGPLTSYSFQIDDFGTGTLNVIGQVYAWSGNLVCCGAPPFGATGPALFSSAAFTIPAVNGFQTVTVNTGAVSLTTGNQYVILLADTGSSTGGSNWGAFFPSPAIANDGGFNIQSNAPRDLSLINTQTWDNFGNNGSLAYTATFGSGVPEPATWAMLILGVGMIGLAARHRRQNMAIPA